MSRSLDSDQNQFAFAFGWNCNKCCCHSLWPWVPSQFQLSAFGHHNAAAEKLEARIVHKLQVLMLTSLYNVSINLKGLQYISESPGFISLFVNTFWAIQMQKYVLMPLCLVQSAVLELEVFSKSASEFQHSLPLQHILSYTLRATTPACRLWPRSSWKPLSPYSVMCRTLFTSAFSPCVQNHHPGPHTTGAGWLRWMCASQPFLLEVIYHGVVFLPQEELQETPSLCKDHILCSQKRAFFVCSLPGAWKIGGCTAIYFTVSIFLRYVSLKTLHSVSSNYNFLKRRFASIISWWTCDSRWQLHVNCLSSVLLLFWNKVRRVKNVGDRADRSMVKVPAW